jgi:hypothetical protein
MKGDQMKSYGSLVMLFGISILFLFTSCGRQADDTTTDDDVTIDQRDGVTDNTITNDTEDENHFWTTDREYTYDQRNEFRSDVNSALDRLNARINELEQRAANSTDDTKEWYNERVDELKEKRAEIQKDMRDFDNTKEDDWEDFRGSITSAWEDIESSWDQMARDDRMQEDGRL